MSGLNGPLVRANITKTADASLQEMIHQCNENFESGRVTKASLNSWIIEHYKGALFKKQIEKIREDHFEPIKHLQQLIKKIQKSEKENDAVDLEKELSVLSQRSSHRCRREKQPQKR